MNPSYLWIIFVSWSSVLGVTSDPFSVKRQIAQVEERVDRSAQIELEDIPPAENWKAFKNEKFVTIVNNYQTYEIAAIVCKSFAEAVTNKSYSRLVTVKTKAEQEFLQKYLFDDQNIKNSVWLGLREIGNSGEFLWNDGSKPYFYNWANQTFKDNEHHCVQMESGSGTWPAGLWVKVNCKKANMMVCERTQALTLENLHDMFLDYKLEQIQEQMRRNEETSNILADLKRELTKVKDITRDPVPLGFIYVQFPGRESPTKLWPYAEWKDVGSEYAGAFFRAEGGEAAPFGEIQEDNTRSLAQVSSSTINTWEDPLIPLDGAWSGYVDTGTVVGGNTKRGVRFRLATGEVRPRNRSVRIWLRIK